ncbi:MAG: OmpW family outer membrane protein [Pseudomonadota bacterium]
MRRYTNLKQALNVPRPADTRPGTAPTRHIRISPYRRPTPAEPKGRRLINADIKKIWINPDVTVDFTSALGATVDAEVDIDPLVIGIGLGYKF